MCKSLWPEINIDGNDTPKSILVQQAKYIGENTNDRIKGYVETTDGSGYVAKIDLNNIIYRKSTDLCHKLYITVPEMNDVRFLLVSLLQNPLDLFPCHIKDEVNEKEYIKLKNNEEVIEALTEILQSDKISNLLSSLML